MDAAGWGSIKRFPTFKRVTKASQTVAGRRVGRLKHATTCGPASPRRARLPAVDRHKSSRYRARAVTRDSSPPAPALWHQLTAVGLAGLMTWLGWLVRSEAAHDHLHVRPATSSLLAATGKLSGASAAHGTTQTPRWLKLGPLPKDAAPQVPFGTHQHRSLAFDSLAAGQWCGLFAPAALPLPQLTAVAPPLPRLRVAPPRTHWLLLPGRAPPACA